MKRKELGPLVALAILSTALAWSSHAESLDRDLGLRTPAPTTRDAPARAPATDLIEIHHGPWLDLPSSPAEEAFPGYEVLDAVSP
jgi:hypothetical protein